MKSIRDYTTFIKSFEIYRNNALDYIYNLESLHNQVKNYISDKEFDLSQEKFSKLKAVCLTKLLDSKSELNEVNETTLLILAKKFKIEINDISSYPPFKINQSAKLCNDLNIDLDDNYIEIEWLYNIQNEMIKLFTRNSISSLLELLNNKTEYQKEYQPAWTFQDFIQEDYRDKLHTLKSIFNKNNSPIEWAIMASLLSQNKIVEVSQNKTAPNNRKSFYRSIYDFMGKPYKKKESFNAIGKYLEFNDGKLYFKVLNDPKFHDLDKKIKDTFLV